MIPRESGGPPEPGPGPGPGPDPGPGPEPGPGPGPGPDPGPDPDLSAQGRRQEEGLIDNRHSKVTQIRARARTHTHTRTVCENARERDSPLRVHMSFGAARGRKQVNPQQFRLIPPNRTEAAGAGKSSGSGRVPERPERLWTHNEAAPRS